MAHQKIQLVEVEIGDLAEVFRKVVREEILKTGISNSDPAEVTFLTIKETCAFLRNTRPTLRELVKAGQLPALKLGGRIMFKKSDVLAAFKPVQQRKFKRSTL